jgi:hypothetical protein
VKRASRTNPIEAGSEWGEEGPAALEREMAVREALIEAIAEADPDKGLLVTQYFSDDPAKRRNQVADFLESGELVASSYGPGISDREMAKIHSKDTNHPALKPKGKLRAIEKRTWRSPKRVVVFGNDIAGDQHVRFKIYDRAVEILRRDWSTAGWTWSWFPMSGQGVHAVDTTVTFIYGSKKTSHGNTRQNPIDDGSEWGEEGPEANELAMAVRGVLSERAIVGRSIADVVVKDPQLVMAAISPEAIDYVIRGRTSRKAARDSVISRESVRQELVGTGWARGVFVLRYDATRNSHKFHDFDDATTHRPFPYDMFIDAMRKAETELNRTFPFHEMVWVAGIFDIRIPGLYGFRLEKDDRAPGIVAELERKGVPRLKQNPSCQPPTLLQMRSLPSPQKLDPVTLLGPSDAAELASKLIGDRTYEVFLVMYVNIRNCVIGYEELTGNSPTGVEVHTNAIVRGALLSGTPAIVTAHQHPSGDPSPSEDDLRLWERANQQLRLMGLVALDHLVIGRERAFSKEQDAEFRIAPRSGLVGREVSGGRVKPLARKKRGDDA